MAILVSNPSTASLVGLSAEPADATMIMPEAGFTEELAVAMRLPSLLPEGGGAALLSPDGETSKKSKDLQILPPDVLLNAVADANFALGAEIPPMPLVDSAEAESTEMEDPAVGLSAVPDTAALALAAQMALPVSVNVPLKQAVPAVNPERVTLQSVTDTGSVGESPGVASGAAGVFDLVTDQTLQPSGAGTGSNITTTDAQAQEFRRASGAFQEMRTAALGTLGQRGQDAVQIAAFEPSLNTDSSIVTAISSATLQRTDVEVSAPTSGVRVADGVSTSVVDSEQALYASTKESFRATIQVNQDATQAMLSGVSDLPIEVEFSSQSQSAAAQVSTALSDPEVMPRAATAGVSQMPLAGVSQMPIIGSSQLNERFQDPVMVDASVASLTDFHAVSAETSGHLKVDQGLVGRVGQPESALNFDAKLGAEHRLAVDTQSDLASSDVPLAAEKSFDELSATFVNSLVGGAQRPVTTVMDWVAMQPQERPAAVEPHEVRLDAGAVQVEIQRMVKQGGGQVVMELTPPDQSKFTIELKLDERGGAQLVVDGVSDSTRTRLEQSAPQLQEQFQQMGLNLQLDMRQHRESASSGAQDWPTHEQGLGASTPDPTSQAGRAAAASRARENGSSQIYLYA